MQAVIKMQESGQYTIEGELNMQTVPDVSKQLHQLLKNLESQSCSFDLAAVSRSDSAGVALLVEAMQLASAAKLDLSFTHLPQQMRDIAGVSALLEILPLQNTAN